MVLLGGGGFGLSSILGGSDSVDTSSAYTQSVTGSQSTVSQSSGTSSGSSAASSLGGLLGSGSSQSSSSASMLTGLLGGMGSTSSASLGNVSTGWSNPANTRQLDTSVAPGARAPRSSAAARTP